MIPLLVSLGSLVAAAGCVASEPPGGSGIDRTGGGHGDPGNGGSGDTAPGSGGSNSASVTSAAQYLTVLETDDCNEAFACSSSYAQDVGGSFSDEYGATVADCIASEASFDMPAVVQSEIAAGKILFDASEASDCLADVAAPTTCAAYWSDGLSYPGSCDAALVGTVADGGACVVAYDCANESSICLDDGTCGADTTSDVARPGFSRKLAPLSARRR